MSYAQYHLLFQTYELYLERGGTPIPLKPEVVAPPSAEPPPSAAPPSESFKAPDQP